MKKFLLVVGTALLMAANGVAQTPAPLYKVTKAVTPPDEDSEIIYEIPDGEVSLFSRNCTAFQNDYYDGVIKSDVKGSLVKATLVSDGNDLWLSNPISEYMLLSYVKAGYDQDGSIVIEGPQLVYEEYDDWEDEFINVYLIPMQIKYDEAGATYVAADDMRFVLKKTENGYEAENPDLLLGLATYGELADLEGEPTGEMGYAWLGYGDRNISWTSRPESNGINPPANATVEKWAFKDPYENALINVALDGNDIYIQGIDRGVTEAWVKATVADGKATIPSGTYLGYNESIQYFSYIWGSTLEYDEEEETLIGTPTDQVVFTYDAEARKLELQDGYAITSMPQDYYVLTLYEEVSIYKQNRDINTPPANPTYFAVTPYDDYYETGLMDFIIPDYDEDGNLLEKDKLYYTIYIDDKAFVFTTEEYPDLGLTGDTENMPYSAKDNYMIFVEGNFHTVYFNEELPENGCGVQSMYINEEGKELRSEIVRSGDSGLNSGVASKAVKSTTFYNMQGQIVPVSYAGPMVCRTVYEDGTVKVSKVIRGRK